MKTLTITFKNIEESVTKKQIEKIVAVGLAALKNTTKKEQAENLLNNTLKRNSKLSTFALLEKLDKMDLLLDFEEERGTIEAKLNVNTINFFKKRKDCETFLGELHGENITYVIVNK